MKEKIGSLCVLLTLLATLLPAQTWRGDEAIAVQVDDSKGRSVADARVVFTFQGIPGETGPDVVATDGNGRAVLADLAPGPWQVEISHPDYLSYIAMVDVRRGKKPLVSASFLEASGRSLSPVKIKFSKGDRQQASPVLEARQTVEPPAAITPTAEDDREALTQIAEAPAAELPPLPPADPEPSPVAHEPVEATPPPPTPEPAAAEPEKAAPPLSEPVPGPVPEPEPVPEAKPEPVEAVEPEEALAPVTELPTAAPPLPEPVSEPVPELEPVPEAKSEPVVEVPPTPEPALAPELAENAPAPAPVDEPRPAPSEQPVDLPEERVETPATPPIPPAPAPAPTALPPPTDPGALVTSHSDGSCRDCESAEWTLQVSVAAPAVDSGSTGRCAGEVLEAASVAMKNLSTSIQLELDGFIGPVSNGSSQEAIRRVEPDLAAAFGGEMAEFSGGRSPCQVVGLVLPKAVRFSRVQLAASDQEETGDCAPGQTCSIGDAVWLGSVLVERGPSATIVWGLFENRSTIRGRRAILTAFYRPPNSNWKPRLPAID